MNADQQLAEQYYDLFSLQQFEAEGVDTPYVPGWLQPPVVVIRLQRVARRWAARARRFVALQRHRILTALFVDRRLLHHLFQAP